MPNGSVTIMCSYHLPQDDQTYSSLALKSYTHLSRTAAFFKPITFTTYVVHLLKSYTFEKNPKM